MNWNLFWGLFVLAFAVACWVCTYYFSFKKKNMDKRCSMHTTGEVIGLSAVNYAGMNIPLVRYAVDGRHYKVSGPKFLGGSSVTVSTPWSDASTKVESNLTTREALPLKLKVKIHRNGFISVYSSPLASLYPVGSEADVYYNPKKPKEAYVQRFEGVPKVLALTFLCSSIVTTALSLLFFFGPRITLS